MVGEVGYLHFHPLPGCINYPHTGVFPLLGKLTALRFLEWVSENPDGVISLPTGKTPEFFIKWTTFMLENWDKAQALANELAHRAEAEGAKPIVFATMADEEINVVLKHAECYYFELFDRFLPDLIAATGLEPTRKSGISHGLINLENYEARIDTINYALSNDDGMRLNNAIFRSAPTQYFALVPTLAVERLAEVYAPDAGDAEAASALRRSRPCFTRPPLEAKRRSASKISGRRKSNSEGSPAGGIEGISGRVNEP